MSVFLNQQLNVGNVSIAQRKLTPIGCDFPMGQTLIQDIANEISQVEAGYSDQALTDAGKIESCQTAIEHFNARWRQAENQKNFQFFRRLHNQHLNINLNYNDDN